MIVLALILVALLGSMASASFKQRGPRLLWKTSFSEMWLYP